MNIWFHKMLGYSLVVSQLAASQEGLSSVKLVDMPFISETSAIICESLTDKERASVLIVRGEEGRGGY
jgi:hypothetical protein